jgi:hypothetical protein
MIKLITRDVFKHILDVCEEDLTICHEIDKINGVGESWDIITYFSPFDIARWCHGQQQVVWFKSIAKQVEKSNKVCFVFRFSWR